MKKLIVKIENNGEELMSFDNELASVSFGALDRGDVSNVTEWGAFSNDGKVEVFDRKRSFGEIISTNPNLNVCIYYQDKFSEKKLATFNVDDYTFHPETGILELTLKDKLIKYQDDIFKKHYEFEEETAHEFFSLAFSNLLLLTDSSNFFISGLTFNIPYIEECSAWDAVNKICQATMTRCFCNEDGLPIIDSEYCLPEEKEKKIIIKPKNILSIKNAVSPQKTSISPHIKAKNFVKMRNQKVGDDVSFSWFRVLGNTENDIIVEVATDTSQAEASFVTPTTAKAKAKLKLYDNFHSFSIENTAGEIMVNVSNLVYDFDHNAYTVFKEKLYTNKPNNLGQTYQPYEIKRTDAINGVVEIELTDKNAVEYYSGGLVGKRVVTNGTINWLGNYFIDNGDVLYGEEENSKPLETNELIQKESTVVGDEFGSTIPLAQYIVDKTKEQYEHGVECLVLEVTPSEYYDIKNDVYVSLFSKYDIVVPYVLSNGVEVPYRTTSEGNPMEFKVVGVEYSYRGLLRQTLHLQEKKNMMIFTNLPAKGLE